MRLGTLALAIFCGATFPAQGAVLLSGHAPTFELPGLQQKLDRVWEFEAKTYLTGSRGVANVSPPEIGFYEFVRDEEAEDWRLWQRNWILTNLEVWKNWTEFHGFDSGQVNESWVAQHVDEIFPFPAVFLAFHYDGTNRIQISPARTFLRFYQNGPNGLKSDTTGYGYYAAAHEFMHYVLERNGIPGRLHHCMFVLENRGTTRMEEITKFLIASKIAAPIIERFAYIPEVAMDPCGSLNESDRAEAKRLLNTPAFDPSLRGDLGSPAPLPK